jgi:hypothetical protein
VAVSDFVCGIVELVGVMAMVILPADWKAVRRLRRPAYYFPAV